jgi:amidase
MLPSWASSMTEQPEHRISAFGDDALGDHDAVAVAELIRRGELNPSEVAHAAIDRAHHVEPRLDAVAFASYQRPAPGPRNGALYGVPTFVKDNTDVAAMPTNHGTAAFVARAATGPGRYARQYLSTGMTVLGKSRLPEFGFNAATEFQDAPPTRNPWHADYSPGGSSGGAAALVASGVVPIAHANDGGGSIRIPAACCGLVGLKPSRGRHINGESARAVPINMISEGVLTRSVRDTAAFVAASEDYWRNPTLPPIGLVEGPARRRLRVGLVLETVTAAVADAPTRAAVENTATVLEKLGHIVEPVELPISGQFADDFVLYWGLLATLTAGFGRVAFDRGFDTAKLDGLTRGLRDHYRRNLRHTPGMLRRLRRTPQAYARLFGRHELVLSPVLAHPAPRLGHLSPTVPYDELMERLRAYVAYTPLHNMAGSPAISLPAGLSSAGVPIGVHLAAAYGDERTLLEVAFALEAEQPWPTIERDRR